MSTDSRKLATDPQELAQLLVARANVGDVDGMVELYEPNAVLAVGGDKIARGTAQIRVLRQFSCHRRAIQRWRATPRDVKW